MCDKNLFRKCTLFGELHPIRVILLQLLSAQGRFQILSQMRQVLTRTQWTTEKVRITGTFIVEGGRNTHFSKFQIVLDSNDFLWVENQQTARKSRCRRNDYEKVWFEKAAQGCPFINAPAQNILLHH